ncbi:MAG: RraA family protein [Pseudomonadales bacterium]|nr:RraA family protein [Pseudomonadales bacterium]MDP7359439.1 RraA family protein [Pseudomonadales bacterium]MDP7597528.1 RraA family protein [Pseudomonadales bacterium]HJN51013.1 RraA family protein [Pseudomonadales bacterium]
MTELSATLLQALEALDTPTVCNALEVVEPSRRNNGFNVRPLVCVHPELPPVVAFARTVRIRAKDKPETRPDSVGHYTYIAEGGPLPSVTVVEDLDEVPGWGALWGEVNTNVHLGLGCKGVITNGSVRDLPDSAKGFQMLAGMVNPSHSFVHVVDWGGTVNVHGMEVDDGDLIHADQHGAVVIPLDSAQAVANEAKKIMARERILIDAAKQPGFNMEKMRQAWAGMAEIH